MKIMIEINEHIFNNLIKSRELFNLQTKWSQDIDYILSEAIRQYYENLKKKRDK